MADVTIGELRNQANFFASSAGDIMIHFDSDDVSHPNRIAEQVAQLESSGADAVGYREMLFWRSTSEPGEAWLYTNFDPRFACGASLAYRRETWERKPFPALAFDEDTTWLSGLRSVGVTSLVPFVDPPDGGSTEVLMPRIICGIHGANTADYSAAKLAAASEWRRVPEWDAHARERMAL